ncbi:hypothetical protein LSTR_LSTR003948 [Laodelphax striatellus]|uniref:Uncharacterized protein n=1 Tax=Laodelphax striatellus TaxID=195883 RepID=A0A482X292_LAOST|nr:hypothetical protein LSTR_LSTR003948 [Laodelphax striatellus]
MGLGTSCQKESVEYQEISDSGIGSMGRSEVVRKYNQRRRLARHGHQQTVAPYQGNGLPGVFKLPYWDSSGDWSSKGPQKHRDFQGREWCCRGGSGEPDWYINGVRRSRCTVSEGITGAGRGYFERDGSMRLLLDENWTWDDLLSEEKTIIQRSYRGKLEF